MRIDNDAGALMLKRLRCLAACLAIGACDLRDGSELPSQTSGTVRSGEPTWHIVEPPEFLRTGGVFGGDSIHFFRVLDGALLRSGDALITLGGDHSRVIIIDPAGEVKDVLGRTGDGPDEFRAAPFLLRSGKGLVLVEHGARRLRMFEGSPLQAPRQFVASRSQSVVSVFEDSTIVIAPIGLPFGRSEPEYIESMSVTPYDLWRGEAVDTLIGPSSPPVPAFPFYTPQGNLSVFIPGRTGCLPENHFGTTGSNLLIADSRAGVLVSLDRTGSVDTIFESSRRARVTQDMVAGAVAYLERVDAQGSSEAFLGKVGKVGDPLPAVWSDALWSETEVWLRHAAPCFTERSLEPQRWDVINLDSGALLGVVEAPSDLQFLAVAESHVLAVETDELDVQHVGMYRIRREPVP